MSEQKPVNEYSAGVELNASRQHVGYSIVSSSRPRIETSWSLSSGDLSLKKGIFTLMIAAGYVTSVRHTKCHQISFSIVRDFQIENSNFIWIHF